MANRISDAKRVERREAGRAVAEAERAGREAEKLAAILSRDARAGFEAVMASARADVREARDLLDIRPMRAKWLARRAEARLERASVRITASGDAERRALEDAVAKKRAKTIKRRRVQMQQVRKMAQFVAVHTIAASVMTPSDAALATHDLKLARRRTKA
jgi:hypothetical protein